MCAYEASSLYSMISNESCECCESGREVAVKKLHGCDDGNPVAMSLFLS